LVGLDVLQPGFDAQIDTGFQSNFFHAFSWQIFVELSEPGRHCKIHNFYWPLPNHLGSHLESQHQFLTDGYPKSLQASTRQLSLKPTFLACKKADLTNVSLKYFSDLNSVENLRAVNFMIEWF
jgi:hypothetical protein